MHWTIRPIVNAPCDVREGMLSKMREAATAFRAAEAQGGGGGAAPTGLLLE